MTKQCTNAVLKQAAATNKTVSELLLGSGLMAASETLADRRLFALNDKQWNAFQAALDTSPKEKPALKALLSAPSVFD